MNNAIYHNLITSEKFNAIEIMGGGVLFRNIETGEKRFYTNHQITKFIRK